jgi:hypothetical protein
LNKFFPANNRIPSVTAWTVVLLALAQLGWLQFQPESGLNTILARLKNPPLSLAPYKDCDDFAARSGRGNVFIKIAGRSRPRPDAESSQSFSDYRDFFLSVWYFRTSYDLYPRRAFLAPADTVINGGWEMMGSQFVPDKSWLSAHDVRSVLTLGFDDLGRTLPARWEPIEQATNQMGGH